MGAIQDRYPPIELLRYAGLFAWLCAAIPLVLMYAWYAEPLGQEQYLGWWILHVLFGFTYWNQVRELPVRTSLWHRVLTVSLLTVTALGVSLVSETALGGILLLIIGGLLPWMLPLPWALTWLLGFPLVESSDSPWGFDVGASLPTHRHFTSMLRMIPNAILQTLLDGVIDMDAKVSGFRWNQGLRTNHSDFRHAKRVQGMNF